MTNPSTTLHYQKHPQCAAEHALLADWRSCDECAQLWRKQNFKATQVATKINPGKFDCYASALPEEPMFILLARDQASPITVLKWATEVEKMIALGIKPESDREKVAEARQLAKDMAQWRHVNFNKWKQTPLFPETEEATRQP